ncbi:hypothetical protein NESM_000903800 [Novymonas esmeraldas]|uniref:Uncharacterized protein n=1 Tax=Novymonas esmeraldas TaxID=1808958 RepID=A0AAW0EY58_9TRYP
MFTHDRSDRVSGISAADLGQRLVELTSRGASSTRPSHGACCLLPLLQHDVDAIVWDAKRAGAAPPRTALLRGDVLDVTPCAPGATLSRIALSSEVRFRVARSRRRRLTGVLSTTPTSSSLAVRRVTASHFYWLDECAPAIAYDEGHCVSAVLQKRIAQWAMTALEQNPLLRSIPLPTLETAFPALLTLPPRERDELLKGATELLGHGMLIWYDEAMIRQFHHSSTAFVPFLLTSNEQRCAAAVLFALATAREVMGDRHDAAARATRFLLDVYGANRVALSPALTAATLAASRAAAPLYANASHRSSGSYQTALLQPYLFSLSRAAPEALQQLHRRMHAAAPEQCHEMAGLVRDAAAAVLAATTPAPGRSSMPVVANQDDVDAFFFSANHALRMHRSTLVTHSCADVPASLAAAVAGDANDAGTAARLRLLEAAPRWWEHAARVRSSATALDETELKINVKQTAAAVRRTTEDGDHAMLAVVRRAQKRRRVQGHLSSESVQAALDSASIRLRRRSFLQLVDLLALHADSGDREVRARTYLEQHRVADAQIADFTALLSSSARRT